MALSIILVFTKKLIFIFSLIIRASLNGLSNKLYLEILISF